MASWTDLPADIAYLIIDKVPELLEHIRFGAVCRSWYEMSREYQQFHSHCRRALPMLLLPSPSAPAKSEPPKLCALSYCLLGQQHQYYYQNLRHHLPFTRLRFCGSSNGWLATQNEDFTITVLYPFGSELLSIHLPYLRANCMIRHDFHLRKLIVAPESTPEDYKIAAVYGDFNSLATIKSGEESWVLLGDQPYFFFSDIIFFKNMVYGVSCFFGIVMVNIEARPVYSTTLHRDDRTLKYMKTYLVESTSSELYVLGRVHYDEGDEDDDDDEEHHEVVDDHVEDAEQEEEEDSSHDEQEEEEDDGDQDEYGYEYVFDDEWEEEEDDDEEDVDEYVNYDEEHHEVVDDHVEDVEQEEDEDSSHDDGSDDENEQGEEEDEYVDDDDADADDDVDEHVNDYEERPPYNIIMWTKRFDVFKLKLDKRSGKVLGRVETKDDMINGDAFFVGDNESMSFPSRCFPGCKSDSIYFTDDLTHIAYYEPNGPEDVGCYNLMNHSIEKFYTMNQFHNKVMPQPIWVVPKYQTR